MTDQGFTAEQREAARRAVDEYLRKTELLWQDMQFELEMQLGLTGVQVAALTDSVSG